MANLAEDKPRELVVSSLVRAKFCELLSALPKYGHQGPALFLVGLFSLLDAIVGRPLPELLAELPLKSEIGDAILGRGELSMALDLIIALEQGQWPEVTRMADQSGIEESILQEYYFKAVEWTSQLEMTA